MTYSAPPLRIRWGFWAIGSAALATAAACLSLAVAGPGSPAASQGGASATPGGPSPALSALAASRPGAQVEAIVQFGEGVDPAAARALVRGSGGRVTGDLHVINGLAARMTATEAQRLAGRDGVHAVSINASAKPQSIDTSQLVTSYNQSLKSDKVWDYPATGKGIGVAVIDTGIAGDLARLQGLAVERRIPRDRVRGDEPLRDDRERHVRPRHARGGHHRRQRQQPGFLGLAPG